MKVAATFCAEYSAAQFGMGGTLGFHEPFFFELVNVVVQTLGGIFPELHAKQGSIKDTLRREEEAFNKTLDRGIELFNAHIDGLQRDTVTVARAGFP